MYRETTCPAMYMREGRVSTGHNRQRECRVAERRRKRVCAVYLQENVQDIQFFVLGVFTFGRSFSLCKTSFMKKGFCCTCYMSLSLYSYPSGVGIRMPRLWLFLPIYRCSSNQRLILIQWSASAWVPAMAWSSSSYSMSLVGIRRARRVWNHSKPCENGTLKSLRPRATKVGALTFWIKRMGDFSHMIWSSSGVGGR